MQSALQVAHKAYLRLTSAIGPIPLALLVSLIAVTAIAWAFTLYQPFAMSASMGSAMGEMEGMAMEDMAMDSMAAGWSFAGLLDDRFQETTQLHLGLSIHGMRPFRTSHMIRTLETPD
jgi:predicted metal-binding membrane protein